MRATSLMEDQQVLKSVGKIITSLIPERDCRDDLMQEALFHLWQSEQERPGQSTSWYLQGCRFRLQHYLEKGRSVDSPKRQSNRVPDWNEFRNSCDVMEQMQMASDQFDHVSAQDIVVTLSRSLKHSELQVLHCLADGMSTAEIVRKLGLSFPTVAKYRRRIAQLATRAGLASLAPLTQAAESKCLDPADRLPEDSESLVG